MEKTFLRQDSRERTYDKTTQAVHRLRASRHPQTPPFGEETPLFGEGIHMSVAARRIATHGPAPRSPVHQYRCYTPAYGSERNREPNWKRSVTSPAKSPEHHPRCRE